MLEDCPPRAKPRPRLRVVIGLSAGSGPTMEDNGSDEVEETLRLRGLFLCRGLSPSSASLSLSLLLRCPAGDLDLDMDQDRDRDSREDFGCSERFSRLDDRLSASLSSCCLLSLRLLSRLLLCSCSRLRLRRDFRDLSCRSRCALPPSYSSSSLRRRLFLSCPRAFCLSLSFSRSPSL